jgi:DNA-binding transcriptional LysR family regulator
MLTIDDLAMFVIIADELNITQAAKKLGKPKATVSRRLAEYEVLLGKTLFVRSTRKLTLTEDGNKLYTLAKPAIDDVFKVNSLIRQPAEQVQGLIKIAATNAIGQHLLWPKIQTLSEKYPLLKVQLLLSEARVNIIEEGIDIAIRMGELEDSELSARHFCDIERLIVATPELLKKYSLPNSPDDLTKLPAVVQSPLLQSVQFKNSVKTTLNWTLCCSNLHLVKQSVLCHKGIAQLPNFMIEQELKNGELIQLLPSQRLEIARASLVSPRRRFKSIALTAVIEHLLEA